MKESILYPISKIIKGCQAEMPSYEGVLTNSELESVISYIKAHYQSWWITKVVFNSPKEVSIGFG